MKRKRWTPREDVDDALLLFREKRKWQIALRRYLIEKQPSPFYAPYFGLDIETFRSWIEIQFPLGCNWESFSVNWQLDHVIPLGCFDFNDKEQLKLAWNFTNIRIQRTNNGQQADNHLNTLGAKAYFEELFNSSHYVICGLMIKKIEQLEKAQFIYKAGLAKFLHDRLSLIETLSMFEQDDLKSINTGSSLSEVMSERAAKKNWVYNNVSCGNCDSWNMRRNKLFQVI